MSVNPFAQIAAQPAPGQPEKNPFQQIQDQHPVLLPHIPTTGDVPQHTHTPEQYQTWIDQAAHTSGVPSDLITAVIRQESGFNEHAVNKSSGAEGLGQFLPGTAKGLGINPFDPQQAINGVAKYLLDQRTHFGNWQLAVAAYNAGPGNVAKFHGIPPFAETRNYVKNVLAMANLPETNMQETLGKINSIEPPRHLAKEAAKGKPQKPGLYKVPVVGATVTVPVPSTIQNVITGMAKTIPWLIDPAGQAIAMGTGDIISALPKKQSQAAYSAMSKAGEVWDAANWSWVNAGLRAANEGNASPIGNYIGSLGFLFNTNTGIDFGDKLDIFANNYGFNSIQDRAYWSRQLGVRDRIMTARPSTLGGSVVQALLGMHADLSRVKETHPWGTSAETYVGEMLGPLNFVPFLKGPGKVADIGFLGRLEAGFRGKGMDAAADATRKVMDLPFVGNRYWRAVTNAEKPGDGLQANVDMLIDHEKNTVEADEPVWDTNHFGNLTPDEQVSLHWLYDHPGYSKPTFQLGDKMLDTNMDVARGGGGSFRTRIQNIAKMQEKRDAEFDKEAPITAALFKRDGPYFPRKWLWEKEDNPAVTTNTPGDSSARGGVFKRTIPDIEQGVAMGKKIDMTHTRAAAWADQYEKRGHYLTFVKNVKHKLANLKLKGGKMAAQEIDFSWPGGKTFQPMTMTDGTVVDLSQPVHFGSGIKGYTKMMTWAEENAPFIKANRTGMGQGPASYALEKSTEAWLKDNQGYSFIWRHTGAPDLAGWAVHDDLMHTVIDANPMLARRLMPFNDFSGAGRIGQWEERIDEARDPKTMKSSETMDSLAQKDTIETMSHSIDQWKKISSFRLMAQMQAQLIITGLGVYHSLLGNVGPRMIADVARLAGANPVKFAKYFGIMAQGYGAGIEQTVRSVGGMTKKLLQDTGTARYDEEILTPQKLASDYDSKIKVPRAWHDAADKQGALDGDRPMGRFISSAMSHDLMSVPYGSLTGPQRALRSMLGGMKWNQDLTFKVQSRNIQAAYYHILTEHEGYEPAEAAQRTRFMSGDLKNLPPSARMAIAGTLGLFVGWHINKYRYGAQMAYKTPRVPLAVNRAVATLNTLQGHPEVDPSTAAVIGNDQQTGQPTEMSLPQSPLLSPKLVYGLNPGLQTGGIDSPGFKSAVGALTIGGLSAAPSLAAKTMFTFAAPAHAPISYDRFGTVWDKDLTKASPNAPAAIAGQIAQSVGSEFNPSLGRGVEDLSQAGPMALMGSIGPEIRKGPAEGAPDYGQRVYWAAQLRQQIPYTADATTRAQMLDAAETLEKQTVGPIYFAKAKALAKMHQKKSENKIK